jgi:hypothetical protein
VYAQPPYAWALTKNKIIMQPIPVKVKNVKVFPYIGGGGVGPVVEPIIQGASGTYSVGTLGLHIFYNLNLTGGKQTQAPVVHGQYYAMGEYEDGSGFATVWMYCTESGKAPQFGRTITMGAEEGQVQPLSVPPYVKVGPLTDITVSQPFPPPAIGQTLLIQGGKGNVIATQVGTPHLMGVEVTGGKRSGTLYVGMKLLLITGKNKDGQLLTFGDETCLAAGDPAVFFRLFP